MDESANMTYPTTDGKSKIPAWLGLPLLASLGLLTTGMTAYRSSWLADSLAMLVAFTIAQTGLRLAQTWTRLSSPGQRWGVLVLAMSVAVVSGVFLESWFWPKLTATHAVWVLPGISLLLLS